jgi:hypothetical protein
MLPEEIVPMALAELRRIDPDKWAGGGSHDGNDADESDGGTPAQTITDSKDNEAGDSFTDLTSDLGKVSTRALDATEAWSKHYADAEKMDEDEDDSTSSVEQAHANADSGSAVLAASMITGMENFEVKWRQGRPSRSTPRDVLLSITGMGITIFDSAKTMRPLLTVIFESVSSLSCTGADGRSKMLVVECHDGTSLSFATAQAAEIEAVAKERLAYISEQQRLRQLATASEEALKKRLHAPGGKDGDAEQQSGKSLSKKELKQQQKEEKLRLKEEEKAAKKNKKKGKN